MVLKGSVQADLLTQPLQEKVESVKLQTQVHEEQLVVEEAT